MQALTSFCRDKWLSGKYREVDVELERDPRIGLGITVAGYVYRKGGREGKWRISIWELELDSGLNGIQCQFACKV